jgi:hypothetical protein
MRQIQLTQSKIALVDDEDFDVLNSHKWCAHRNKRNCYAVRNAILSDGKKITEKMHRVILARKLGRAIVQGMHTDHVNGNGLDNRRENLREVTISQNHRNCRRHSQKPSSQFLGVDWHKAAKRWRARIKEKGKEIHISWHSTELAAAQARDEFIAEHPGLHARLNFGTTDQTSKGST